MMIAVLESLRDALRTIPGVLTCRIGIEANISPADYPLIRIVPTKITDSDVIPRRRIECWVYFGTPVSESDTGGLEAVYKALLTLEDSIRRQISAHGGICRETVLDEDRLQPFKMMAILAEVEG